MQVFVSGTWKPEKAESYKDQALLLGEQLALAGINLACGPGTGIARYVIDGYKTASERGVVRYYLPSHAEMEKVGEVVAAGADDIIETGFDYPMRNVYQVQQSQGLFVLTGGDGALEEAIVSLADYDLPVAVIRNSGTAAIALEALLNIYPQWSKRLMFGDHVGQIMGGFLELVKQKEGSLAVEEIPSVHPE